MTYHMNRLQSLPGRDQLLRDGEPGRPRSDASVIVAREMRHPMYTFSTLDPRRGSARSRAIAGRGIAGAHLGYGFHEDGCRSGYEAAEALAERATEQAA